MSKIGVNGRIGRDGVDGMPGTLGLKGDTANMPKVFSTW